MLPSQGINHDFEDKNHSQELNCTWGPFLSVLANSETSEG